jgi:hypothetical protein
MILDMNVMSESMSRINEDPDKWGQTEWVKMDLYVKRLPKYLNEDQAMCISFYFISLRQLLPCEECRLNHFAFLRSNPPIGFKSRREVKIWVKRLKVHVAGKKAERLSKNTYYNHSKPLTSLASGLSPHFGSMNALPQTGLARNITSTYSYGHSLPVLQRLVEEASNSPEPNRPTPEKKAPRGAPVILQNMPMPQPVKPPIHLPHNPTGKGNECKGCGGGKK